jgi:hypothetical protein
MQWFGESWGAPICRDVEHVVTPVGKVCIECKKEIERGDLGFVLPYLTCPVGGYTEAFYHRDCLLANFGFGQGTRNLTDQKGE